MSHGDPLRVSHPLHFQRSSLKIEAPVGLTHAISNMLMWNRLEKKWNGLQVGRQGSYSIERLESFNAYCDVTSRVRVILVCLLTPIPTLAVAIFLECLPLRKPSEGWRANWMFWVRLAIAVFTMILTANFSFASFIPVLKVSLLKIFNIAFSLTVMYMTTMLYISSKVGFPLPFIEQIGSVVLAIYIPVVFLLVLGTSPFAKTSNCRPYFVRFQRCQHAYLALAIIYPYYKALYDLTPSPYRTFTVVMLPIWNFGSKYLVIRATRELEDFIPQIISFTVDLYTSLFISVCMSSAGSLLLTALFIFVDLGLTFLEYRELRANAFVVYQLLNQQCMPQGYLQSTSSTESPDLLGMVLSVTRDPCGANIALMRGVRLHACLPHPLPEHRFKQLQILAASGLYCQNVTNNTQLARRRNLMSCFLSNTSVQPIAPNLVNVLTRQPTQKAAHRTGVHDSKAMNGNRSEHLVLQGLQLLFHCEYLALVEYIECVVPIVYLTFKSILEKLPNVVYYPGGAGNWGSYAISNILLLTMLEIGSFLFLNHFIQHKFRISTMYLVAFVLETQMCQVQSMLVLSLILLLSYELAHHGVDFTFQFDWIR
ncbi:hypothetical protein Plhal304r1_c035g0109271 [Plasmopara halstedii]